MKVGRCGKWGVFLQTYNIHSRIDYYA